MTRIVASERLPASDDGVDVERIELESEAASSGTLGRDHRGAAAEKPVQHDAAPRARIHDRVGHQRDRLHGGM